MNKELSFLALDVGLHQIGVAHSRGLLAEPLTTLTVRSPKDALKQVLRIILREQPNRVVVGLPTGSQGQWVRELSQALKQQITTQIVFWDETLTTQEARSKLLHTTKKRRSRTEHAAAAAVILQDYLDLVERARIN